MEQNPPFLPPGDYWLNNEQAAAYLCTSVRTLERVREKEKIPYSYFGKEVRYRKSDLDDYMNRNMRNTG